MSSYRSYVPWNKSGLSSSYSGSRSSSSRTYGTGKVSDSGISSSASQYDGGGGGGCSTGGGCGRRLGTGGDTSSMGRNNYLSGSSYRSPYLGPSYSRNTTGSYLSSSKDNVTRSATTSNGSGATERRDNKENERMSLRDRYSSGTYPGRSRDSSYSSKDKDDSDTVSSHRALGRSISAKSNRDASPETTLNSVDVGVKTDRMGYGSSLSPYRLYTRTYSRSTSRDSAPDISSSTTSTTAATPGHTTSSLRYGCSSRYGSNIIRSPVSEKPPTVFGRSSLGYSSRSSSRSNSQLDTEEPKKNEAKPISTAATTSSKVSTTSQEVRQSENKTENEKAREDEEGEVTLTTFITIVTRGTSPTPPSTTSYVRTRRTDLARVIEKTIEKRKIRPEMLDKETQSDPGENTARLSRYGVSSRWSAYLDRYPSAASTYSPVSRYTSRYGYSSSRSDDKDTSVKSSAHQEISDGTSTNEAPKVISSTVILNNDVAKGTTLPGRKINSSPSVSSEKKTDNDISNVKQSEIVVDKPNETYIKVTKCVGGREIPNDASIIASSESKQTACVKTKSVSDEDEGKPVELLKKNIGMTKESEVESLTRGQLVKNVGTKYSVENTGTMPKPSRTTSTGGSSSRTPTDGNQSKVSSDSKTEGVGSAQVPCVTNSSKTFPAVDDISQENEVITEIKSRNASSVILSLDDVSDKTSSCEANKATSDTAAACTSITKIKPLKNTSVTSSTKIGTAAPLGIKSKSSSATSLSSEEGSIKTSSVETSIPKTQSERGIEGLNAVRKKSPKNVPSKYSETPGTESVACMISSCTPSDFPCSEASADKTSLYEGIPGKKPYEDGSRTNASWKQASISTALPNEEALTKTHLSAAVCTKTLPDTPTSKLPPPVPKCDSSTQGLKTSSSLHSLNKFSVANKDFRKSSLNVELPDAMQAEAFRKMQEKQRHTSPFERKFNRSNSVSSGDSETSCPAAGSTVSLPIEANSKSTSSGTSKSFSKLYVSSSTSKLPSGTTDSYIVVPKLQGSDRTKATPNSVKGCSEPLRDTGGAKGLRVSDSGTDASSIETSSSSSRSSSSDEEDEELFIQRQDSVNLRHRTRISPTGRDSQQTSVSSDIKDSNCDELSVSADKPPRPPVSPKPSKTEEHKSFIMRALAPVTNLFKGKQENNKSVELQRTGSTQSLNKSENEGVEVKKSGAPDDRSCQYSVLDRKEETGTGSEINYENDSIKFNLKYKIRKQESGERAWWLDSNPNIPEGIKRIVSNTSINEQKDREGDNSTASCVQHVSSNDSVNILQEQNSSSRDSKKKVKYKVCKDAYQQSEELPGLSNISGEVLEGINRIRSNSSITKIGGDEKGEVNTDGSVGATRQPRSKSSQNNKDSEIDTTRYPEGAEKTAGKLHRLRHQQSGELPWWLDNCAPVPEGVQRIQSNTSLNKLPCSDMEERGSDSKYADKSVGLQKTPSNLSLNKYTTSHYADGIPSVEEEKSKTKLHRLRHQQSGELPWWLDNNAPVPEGVLRIQSNSSINKLQDTEGEKNVEGVQRTTNNALINKPLEYDGENKTAQAVQRIRSNSSVNKLQSSDSDSKKSGEAETVKKKTYKIRHQESGELPWWLSKSASQSDGIQRMNSSQSVNKVQAPEQKREEGSSKRNFPYKLRHQESGEKAWWLCSRGDIPEGIRRLDSSKSLHEDLKSGEGKQDGEEDSHTDTSEEDFNKNKQEKEDVSGNLVPKFPLVLPATSLPGGTLQPKEQSGRLSPYDNLEKTEQKAVKNQATKPRPKNVPLFIGNHTNIDDILGTAATLVNPVMGLSRIRKKLEGRSAGSSNEEDSGAESSDCEEIGIGQMQTHDSAAKTSNMQRVGNVTDEKARRPSSGMIKLDDTALQLYKDGDYGSYLDLEASINEQQEEFDGFQTNRKNSIVLRTQLSVRVHTIIEKLLNSEGRELRRALFSLKQIFQEDKDLVHEFVQNDGLACLIKVGSEADQNYQNYILRALGQVMLYVDGMNGVMEHNETVQWLYALIASKFRLVVKTALKLLLVFIEYVETNCLLLIKAVHAVDTAHGFLPWNNIVKLLKDYDAADTELLIYAMTLVNKTLNGIPDQDTYYDQVDALEEQGIEGTIQRYMSKQGTDLDLLRQFQIYEAVLHHEDGEEKGTPLKQLDEAVRKTLRNRKSLSESMTTERRKSRRHSTGTSPMSSSLGGSGRVNSSSLQTSVVADDDESESSSSRSSPVPEINGSYKESKADDAGVTPALRRRRERAERQRSFIREQQETAATLKATLGSPDERVADENQRLCKRLGNGTLDNGDSRSSNKLQQVNRTPSRKDLTPLMNAVNKLQDATSETPEGNGILKKPWVLSMMYGKNSAEEVSEDTLVGGDNDEDDSVATSERKKIMQLKRENTVKDLTQKLSSQNIIHSPVEDGNNKNINRIGDMTGLISKAKEGLAKSKSKQDVVKSPTCENIPKQVEAKKSETELHWEELVHSMKRPLSLCDLDFTDLRSDDEVDILSPANISNGVPPPPPPVPMVPGMPPPRGGAAPPPPPPATRFGTVAPPPMPPSVISPPLFGVSLRSQRSTLSNTSSTDTTKAPLSTPAKKTKKTVKLFWKEVRDDPIILAKLQQTGMIWDELKPVSVDTQKLEHLFESRAKDLITKKQQEMNKNKEIIVLDHKRSNAINIGMTKLPPPRSIKTAILKMDATIMNREGIEKLLTMLPTEEERSKIQEAQVANPDMPLGSAEQFLLTLASITELPARLKLWAFKLDFENSEKEIAEPLMDLKQGMETLKTNKTFRGILSTLLSIGIFLNGNEVKGFQIEYLAKVPEVKDTVHKHSLLHHLCHMVMEKFSDSSDLYSEIGAVTRASKVDFDELSANILKMEQECKASWDHLKVIAKHDGSTMKVKMSDFLADCAERIIVLSIVHRRVINRFHKFLLWLGIPLHRVADTKPNEFCRVVSEFSLEYRTTRERVLQQLEKKANHRERNKTRGKMITEVGKFRTKEDRADAELRQLLGSDLSDAESIHGTLPWRRQRKDLGRTVLSPLAREEMVNGNLTDGDDEILESLVKTATKAPATRTTPRERKRTRHADRKSLKRSRTRENNLVEGGRESP